MGFRSTSAWLYLYPKRWEKSILSDGFLEDYIQRCQTDSPQEKMGRRKQHKSVARELRQVEQRMENLITALADASLPKLEISRRYKKEEAKKQGVGGPFI